MKRDQRFQLLYTSIEEDPEFLDLTPDGKLAFFILKFSSFNNAANIFPLYWEAFERHSGLDRDRLQIAICELWSSGFVACQYPVFWIVNGLKFNPFSDPGADKHLVNIYKIIRDLPRFKIVADFCRYYEIEPPMELLFDPRNVLDLRVPDPVLEAGYREEMSWAYDAPYDSLCDRLSFNPALLRMKYKGSRIKNENRLSPEIYLEIVTDLNDLLQQRAEATGRDVPRGFKSTTKATQKLIRGRIIDDGFTIDDFKKVHRIKIGDWYGSDFEKHLNPSTLYRPSHFEKYLNQTKKQEEDDVIDKAERVRSDIKASARETAR